ncbi:phage tail tape measure protein [Clostridium cagae]|uniref:phage tail tape measure protein n=1 Tax=Clostridium cagae TaxID=2080751 RepID=UPI003F75D459
MAKKEIYRLGINIKVDGDKQSKKVLTEVEKSTKKVKKKVRDLDKLTASPSAKLKDTASTAIDKIKSKTEKLNNKTATAKLKAKDEASKTINKVQNKLNSWIKTGAKKVISVGLAGAVALGGLGIGSAIKTFSEFEQGLSNVKAVTQATDTEMKVLKDTAKSLGASTAWSAVQVTQAEELLGQAGFSVKETTSALPGLLSLASAGGLDLAAATDIASGTLRAFNIDAAQTSHVADVLALSAAATNSDVTDLGETMKYAAPVAQALGISFEDTAAASGLLSNANIKGSQAGTILRQTMARLASPTKEAAKVMKAYGINAFDAQGNMKPLNGVINNLNSSLGKLTSQKRADIISTVFGTESMSGVLALMNQGGQSLGDLSENLKQTKGSADEMAKTKLDNLAGQWTILKSAVETMKITLGERLAPYAKDFVTWFTAKMPDITDSVVKFVDTISNNIGTIKTAGGAFLGLTGAFVGMSAINKIGTTVGTFGKLLGGFKTAATADALVKTTGAMQGLGLASKIIPALLSPGGLATAGIGIAGVVAAKQLSKEVVPAVDLFADKIDYLKDSTNVSGMGGMSQEITKISNATKEAVGAYMEMDNSVQRTLLNLRYKNTTITSDIANDVIEQFTNMNKTITNKLDENLKSDSSKIQAMFNNNTKLTAEEQTSIMTQLENHYNKQKTTTENALKEISSIWKEASQENRATNEEENNRINELRSQMTATAITNLSETEKESAIILGRIKDQTGRITAETAADIVQKLNEQRQQTVDAANAEYAARVNIAEQIRAEGGQKAEETANKMINEAARQRDETIAAADATRSQGIEVLKQAYGDLETSVDINTGQILTFWGRLKQWWDNTTFGTKFAEIQTNGVVGMVGQNPNNSSSKITKPASEIETDLVGAPNSLSRETIRWGKQNYTGTNNAIPGINSVGERGMELVLGRSLYDFKGGEKVLNNGETKSFLSNLGQAPIYNPQVQTIGAGGNNIQVDVQVNNNDTDVNGIVCEVTNEVGRKLKEVLTNIKK